MITTTEINILSEPNMKITEQEAAQLLSKIESLKSENEELKAQCEKTLDLYNEVVAQICADGCAE